MALTIRDRASLVHSSPLTRVGTKKRAANFSVSLSAASNAFTHFKTDSKRLAINIRILLKDLNNLTRDSSVFRLRTGCRLQKLFLLHWENNCYFSVDILLLLSKLHEKTTFALFSKEMSSVSSFFWRKSVPEILRKLLLNTDQKVEGELRNVYGPLKTNSKFSACFESACVMPASGMLAMPNFRSESSPTKSRNLLPRPTTEIEKAFVLRNKLTSHKSVFSINCQTYWQQTLANKSFLTHKVSPILTLYLHVIDIPSFTGMKMSPNLVSTFLNQTLPITKWQLPVRDTMEALCFHSSSYKFPSI